MKVRHLLCIALVLATASICILPLQAADLTFYVGGVNPGSVEYKHVKTSLDSSAVLGFRFATHFVPVFGLEHSVGFSPDYLFPHNATAVKSAKGFIYHSNVIFNVPTHKVVPYFTAGVGLIHQYGDGDMPVGTRFAFNYGGGLKFPRVYGPMGLRFDMRGYQAGVTSNWVSILEVSGGVYFSIGK